MKKAGSAENRPPTIDTIRFEVIRNLTHSFVEEMAAALARSAYSTNIKTRRDHSCTFFDATLRMVDQATDQPSHLAALVLSVPAVLKEYGVENLEPGDGILVSLDVQSLITFHAYKGDFGTRSSEVNTPPGPVH